MKEYIGRDLFDEDGNVVGREYSGELIRCKDCQWHIEAHYEDPGDPPYIKHLCKWLKGYQFSLDHYCGLADKMADGQTVIVNEQEMMITLCRDCKYWSPIVNGKVGYCNIGYETVTERYDGYCSHAERKEE